MNCSSICKNCSGVNCENVADISGLEEEDAEEDDFYTQAELPSNEQVMDDMKLIYI
jgi:hypothetical protein